MKRILSIVILITLLLCGCVELPEESTPPVEIPSQDTSPIATEPPETGLAETEPSETEPTETDPPETQPEHSPLYIPGVSVEDVIQYYNEVVLDAEYVNNGNPSNVQKWDVPILFTVYGDNTEEDWRTLAVFTQWLNEIEGFPGIEETKVDAEANLRIYFCDAEQMVNILGDNFYGNDGGVTFWYDNNQIYNGIICIRTDLDQKLRNSVIIEELYNGLGPVQDTDLRPDSIIYSGFSQPQTLTAVDELILKLLYHPQIRCGMNASECENVIRQLYY